MKRLVNPGEPPDADPHVRWCERTGVSRPLLLDCNSDPADRAVLLALSEGEVIGIGELGRMDEDCAEIALLVRHDCQGEGIGTALGHELVEVARELGYTRLQAYMLAENRAMRRIIAKPPFTRNWEGSWGELCVTVELESPATVG